MTMPHFEEWCDSTSARYNKWGEPSPTHTETSRITELKIQIRKLKANQEEIKQNHALWGNRIAGLESDVRDRDTVIKRLESTIKKKDKIIKDFEDRERGKIKFITDNPDFLEVD